MKSLSLKHACLIGGALMAAANAAHALAPNSVPAANRAYISGATATDIALATLFVRNGTIAAPAFCQAGTIDVYVETTTYANAKNRAILCTLNVDMPNLQLVTGDPVAVMKESNGGSGEGTTVIASALARQFLDVSSTAAIGCPTGTAIAANALGGGVVNNQALTLHTSCNLIGTLASPVVTADFGIADVNPALFTAGTSPITAGQIANLSASPLYQPMFAVGVSLNAYRALQRAQGLTLDDTAANIPTMTTTQMRALYSGTLTTWDNVTSPTGVAINSTTLTGGVTVPNQVYVCRRGDDSGTQASFASYFLNERCTADVTPFVNATNATCQQAGCTWAASFLPNAVFAAKGSGDVRNCLDAHNDNDTFAVGVLGSESKYDSLGGLGGSANASAGTQAFRYVALDGRKPRLEDVANGNYDFVEENVLNRRLSPAISGKKDDVANYIVASFSSVDLISTLIVPQAHGLTGGLSGGLGGGTPNTVPASTATVQANPVSAFTKSLLGPVNDCGPAIAVSPTLSKP